MTTTINILLFTNEFPPGVWGGLGIAVYGLCMALRQLNQINLLVVTRSRDSIPEHEPIVKIEVVDDIKVIRVLDGNPTIEQLTQYFDPTKFELIHTHGVHFATQTIALKEAFGLPIIYSNHSNALIEAEFDVKLKRIDVPPQNALFTAADIIVVHSKASADDIIRFYPELANKIFIIANGLPNLIQNTAPPQRDIRSKELINCLYIGRFHPRKGIDILMQAIPLVHQKLPLLRFVFIGGHSTQYDEMYRSRLVRWAESDPRIVILDWLEPDALLTWYLKADTVIIPSLYEPFGNIAIEALAMGIPVIASEVGGLREIINNGVNGFLVPQITPALFAESIIDLFSNPQRYREMSRQGGKAARTKYNWKNLVKRYTIIYNTISSGKL